MDNLNTIPFIIPPFRANTWVSTAAEQRWKKRLDAINSALLESCLQGVSDGVWANRRIRIMGAAYFSMLSKLSGYRLSASATFLGMKDLKGPVFYDVLLSANETEQVRAGIPDCCHDRNKTAENSRRKEMLWESARGVATALAENQTITLEGPLVSSAFWKPLILDPCAYHLCRLDCAASLKTLEQQLDYMASQGFRDASEWLREIYSWPVEWSARNGICEFRTPIVKTAYDTDATGQTYRIRIKGDAFPEEGAPGTSFPYRRKAFLKITDSKSFKEGLKYGT